MKKVALITGITGQDGSYLAKFLLTKDYEVHGTCRIADTKNQNFSYLGIEEKIIVHPIDLANYDEVNTLLKTIKPDEIYHLAAQSSIPESIKNPLQTIQFNISSTLNLVDVIRNNNLPTKIFHASSSEIFDPNTESPLTTHSPIRPVHPYAVSKASSHFIVQTYRKNYNLFAVNGILFPHESPLRRTGSLITSLITQAEAVSSGRAEKIFIAELDNIRDIGDARSYIEAIWLSLQTDIPDDYIICSGSQIAIKDIVNFVLSEYKLDYYCIEINNSLVRQPNIEKIFGDSSETKQKLGWANSISINETIRSIIGFKNENKHEN